MPKEIISWYLTTTISTTKSSSLTSITSLVLLKVSLQSKGEFVSSIQFLYLTKIYFDVIMYF